MAIDTRHGLEELVHSGVGMHVMHSMGILAGFCLETSLKACLMQNGHGSGQARSFRHDLRELWAEAAKYIDIETPMPEWAGCLADHHHKPYEDSYPDHKRGVAIQDPEVPPVELKKILDQLIRQSSSVF